MTTMNRMASTQARPRLLDTRRCGTCRAAVTWADSIFPAATCSRCRDTGARPDGTVGESGFRLLRRLGAGAAGSVYLAWHEGLNRHVALKCLSRADERTRERFHREGRTLAQLRHPHILEVYDMGVFSVREAHDLGLTRTDSELAYLALEFVEGQDLDVLLDDRGPLPMGLAFSLFDQVLAGLEHAHAQGIVHRDIKGRNLLVDREMQVKIADFGLAAGLTGEPSLTVPGTIMGSPYSMSPEQALGAVPDHRSDLYSAGTVLFRMLTGEMLFDAERPTDILKMHVEVAPRRPSQVRPSLDGRVDALLARCLAKNRKDRFPTATALREALRDVAASAPSARRTTGSAAVVPERKTLRLPGRMMGPAEPPLDGTHRVRPLGQEEVRPGLQAGRSPATDHRGGGWGRYRIPALLLALLALAGVAGPSTVDPTNLALVASSRSVTARDEDAVRFGGLSVLAGEVHVALHAGESLEGRLLLPEGARPGALTAGGTARIPVSPRVAAHAFTLKIQDASGSVRTFEDPGLVHRFTVLHRSLYASATRTEAGPRWRARVMALARALKLEFTTLDRLSHGLEGQLPRSRFHDLLLALAREVETRLSLELEAAPVMLDMPGDALPLATKRVVYECLTPIRILDRLLVEAGLEAHCVGGDRALGRTFGLGVAGIPAGDRRRAARKGLSAYLLPRGTSSLFDAPAVTMGMVMMNAKKPVERLGFRLKDASRATASSQALSVRMRKFSLFSQSAPLGRADLLWVELASGWTLLLHDGGLVAGADHDYVHGLDPRQVSARGLQGSLARECLGAEAASPISIGHIELVAGSGDHEGAHS